MSLVEKLVAEVEIKSDAQAFHDVWAGRPHHIAGINPEKVKACTPHVGEFGKTDSVLEWNYVHDGVTKVSKTKIEIDNDKTKIVFKFVGGHFTEDYKDFHITVEIVPNPKTGGNLARWTFDYERNNEKIPEPVTLLAYVMGLTRDIDAHLLTP